jgi:hypothetical protein
MDLTGKDVHKAFVAAFPYLAPSWNELPDTSKDGYDSIADELNKLTQEDAVTIEAIKCPSCGEMISNLKGHPCTTKKS